MSSTPLQAPKRNPTAKELLDSALRTRDADMSACDYAELPFYIARFRAGLLRLVQNYFTDSSRFPTGPDLPDMNCLVNAPGTTSKLDVRATFDVKPPVSEQACMYVRVPELQFEKAGMGDLAGQSANRSSQYRMKLGQGTVVFMMDHPDHDVAVTALDGLHPFLEGTKHHWLPLMGLTSFDITKISEGEELRAAPQRMMRASMTASFTGRILLDAYTEALPLKRIELTPHLT